MIVVLIVQGSIFKLAFSAPSLPTLRPLADCEDGYIRTTNRYAAGGTLRSQADTVMKCQDVCDVTPVSCYGFDFARDDDSCYIFLNNYTLSEDPIIGVDNYRKSDACQSTWTENLSKPKLIGSDFDRNLLLVILSWTFYCEMLDPSLITI